MAQRHPTLILTCQHVEATRSQVGRLFAIARDLCPDDFPAEETRELHPMRGQVTLRFVDALRREVAEKTGIAIEHLSLDRFSIHGCGPVSLHDDAFRYPDVYFAIVIAHSGRLGIVDAKCRAIRHEVGEILLLDPRKKHGLVPEGRTAREHPYERTHSPVYRDEDRFLFLCFDVRRPLLSSRFREATSARTLA